MMKRLKKIVLNIDFELVSTKYSIFIKFLVAWYMFDILICSLNYSYFWGEKSIYLGSQSFGLSSSNYFMKIINLLNIDPISNFAFLFIIAQLISGFLILFNISTNKFTYVLFYLLSSNLQVPIAYGLDGGNNLANILFLYLLIFDWSDLKCLDIKTREYTTFIAFSLTVIQVCLVYLVAGFSKVEGDLWQNGTALYYIMQIPQYYTPYLSDLALQSDIILVLGNYATIIFQLYFPIIFFKPVKRIWISIGILLHISISLVLGLLQFGALMSIVYILFFDQKWIDFLIRISKSNEKIKRLFKRKVFK